MANRRRVIGFTLIEMAVTLLIIGLIAAIGIPAYRGFGQTHRMRAAAESVAGQIRAARERAMATGTDQILCFELEARPAGDPVQAGTFGPPWSLPRGVVYDESAADDLDSLWLRRDGRASPAGTIVLVDSRGLRDTIRVLASGLVVTR